MERDRFSVCTFNLFNLNKPGLPIYTDKNGWTQSEYDGKINWVKFNIEVLRPDIFGFQELWHADALKQALDESNMKNDYDVVTPADATGKHIVSAALVRKGLLVGEPEWIVAFPRHFILKSAGDDPQTPLLSVNIKSFSRPVLRFEVKPRDDAPAIHFYVCHFKSKAPTQVFREDWFKENEALYKPHAAAVGAAISTIRRTAEAAALRFILTDRMKNTRAPVIVLGDINDGQHSNTVNILTEQPRFLVGDSRGGRDTALYTAQTLQEYRNTRDVYYTHIHQDIMESLDHILVSEEFYDYSRKRLWIFDGLTINNDHLNFEDHKERGTNDHGIVRATFKYKPFAQPQN